MAKFSDIRRDFCGRQLSTLPRLRSLRNLDLQLVRMDQILSGDSEARRSDLLHPIVGTGIVCVDCRIFPALSGVAACAEAVHGNC